jgi:polyferredoxin
LLAVTRAAEQKSLSAAIFLFFTFFIGTSLLFLLAPFVGVLSRLTTLQTIGRMAAGLMGLYYLYSGTILLSGGLKTL